MPFFVFGWPKWTTRSLYIDTYISYWSISIKEDPEKECFRLAPEENSRLTIFYFLFSIFLYAFSSLNYWRFQVQLSYQIIKLFNIINYFQLTYVIYSKERRQVRSAEDLKITDKMKEKAGDYVRKKMNNYGKEYKRSPTKE